MSAHDRPWCWWCRACREDYAPAWRETHDAANYGEARCWSVTHERHRMIRAFFSRRDAFGRPLFGPAIRVDDVTIL